jgi:hypothetical protein
VSKSMEFQGQHGRDTIEVSGPDGDGEYRVKVAEFDDYSRVYLSRDTLVELHAFIGELLDRRRGT